MTAMNEGFAPEALKRLPLAEATYRLLDHTLDDDALDDLFQSHRGRSYEKRIRFPHFVQLIADALIEHGGSGHKSFAKAQEAGELESSMEALYGKLARLPLSLSQGFLLECTNRLQQVIAPTNPLPHLGCLDEFPILVIDGKKIKHVAHRLKILRHVRGQVLAAKLVVALDLRTGLAVAMSANPDGEANDAPLVPDLLVQVRPRYKKPILFIEDRQFSDLTQPALIKAEGDHFLIRHNAKTKFHRHNTIPVRHGVDEQGRAYFEEWGTLGAPTNPRRVEVRRITLLRPGEEDVSVVTDLLDAEKYPAVQLLAAYLERWGIERVFQRITEVFNLRSLIGSTPEAGVFQASFCLLLYNVVVTLRSYLAEAKQCEPEKISTENLFYDIQQEVIALNKVLSAGEIVSLLSAQVPVADLGVYLRGLLSGQWSELWWKAPSRGNRPKTAREYLHGGHSSVFRLQQQARKDRPKEKPPSG